MPTTYKRIVPVFGLLLAFTLIAGAASAQVSDQPRPVPGAQAPDQPRPEPGAPARPAPGSPAPVPGASSQAKPQAQIARGELTDIDAVAKMLTIKPAEGAEQKFQYNEETKVTGARGGVSGLATQSGKQVVVHFNAQGANRVATEIEIQGDKPGAGDRPAPSDRPGAGDRPGAPGAPGAGGDKPSPGDR